MDFAKEQELKKGIEALCTQMGVQSYILAVVDNSKVQFLGTVSPGDFMPIIMDKIVENLLKVQKKRVE